MNNYRGAIAHSGIKKIVGLSSMGAGHRSGTGNLVMSYMLEHSFDGLPTEQTFIRPAYYYSNWLGYAEMVKEQGILPTFFPIDQKIPMVAPPDVSGFVAKILANENSSGKIYELVGPTSYSSIDVADAFGDLFHKTVEPQQIPREQWKETLQQVGFSDDGAKNIIEMTEAVINGKTQPEKAGNELVELETDLHSYLRDVTK